MSNTKLNSFTMTPTDKTTVTLQALMINHTDGAKQLCIQVERNAQFIGVWFSPEAIPYNKTVRVTKIDIMTMFSELVEQYKVAGIESKLSKINTTARLLNRKGYNYTAFPVKLEA